MPGLRIAATVTTLVALAVAPAAAQATVGTTQITNWTSSEPGTPANNPYLISFDNPPEGPTTLTVSGKAPGATTSDQVDIVCYSGATPTVVKLATVSVNSLGTFTASGLSLKSIAGSVCRLRAIPAGQEPSGDNGNFAGPQLAVSEAALPVATIPTGGLNAGTPYNIYVNDVTLTGYAAWSSPGLTPATGEVGCGGPFGAPVDPVGDVGNFAINCVGSLLKDDLGAFGGRSEVQIDGANAYDPAAAQGLFLAVGKNPASQNVPGFPTGLTGTVTWDPVTGLLTSRSVELWVVCHGPNEEIQSINTCPSFDPSGVKLERDITTSDGGRVVTMTDTWSSTDGKAHSLNVLYDDYVGVPGMATGDRGYEFPGQSSFSEYGPGSDVPGASRAPGSILVRTNVTAPEGIPTEAVGAITFGAAPSAFHFVTNEEFEEQNLLAVPAGGSASLTYIYSVGYSVAEVRALAIAAQDYFQGPALAITSPASGTTVSNPTVTLSGTATSGSGISSLSVGGHPVSVGPGGAWSTQVTLSPGTSTITAQAIDGAGESAQAQDVVVYSPSSVRCRVPKTKGMKVSAAKRALRRAHCRVGKIKPITSHSARRGRVASTSPRPGRRLRAGAKVELFVSKGP